MVLNYPPKLVWININYHFGVFLKTLIWQAEEREPAVFEPIVPSPLARQTQRRYAVRIFLRFPLSIGKRGGGVPVRIRALRPHTATRPCGADRVV